MPELPDVITNEVIASEYTNDIRDRTLQRYDDIATRTSENSSPVAGDLSYLQDIGDLDAYHAGAWRHIGLPVGTIIDHAGGSVPIGFLVCDGSLVSRTTYAGLFAQIGTIWGAGDGSTTFGVPDLRGRVARGVAASGTGDAVGETFGADTHTHTGPSHAHTGPSHAHNVDIAQFNTGSDGHTHTLESGFAKWGHTVSINFYELKSTEDWSYNRTAPDPLMPDSGSNEIGSGTGLGGDTGLDSHSHTVNPPNTASGAGGTGNTGASGTAATGSSSTIQAGAAVNKLIRV